MVSIDEVQTEVIVEAGGEPAAKPDKGRKFPTRKEDIRDVVRAILHEELERHWRTEARR